MSLKVWTLLFLIASLSADPTFARICGNVQGIAHGPQHRPIHGARVMLRGLDSAWSRTAKTNVEAELSSVPAGDYVVTFEARGYRSYEETIALTSGSAPIVPDKGRASQYLGGQVTMAAVNDGRYDTPIAFGGPAQHNNTIFSLPGTARTGLTLQAQSSKSMGNAAQATAVAGTAERAIPHREVTPSRWPGEEGLSRQQRKNLLKHDLEKMKQDADQLSALARSLQEELGKTSENFLSLKVVEKAAKIEKLAKRIKNTVRWY